MNILISFEVRKFQGNALENIVCEKWRQYRLDLNVLKHIGWNKNKTLISLFHTEKVWSWQVHSFCGKCHPANGKLVQTFRKQLNPTPRAFDLCHKSITNFLIKSIIKHPTLAQAQYQSEHNSDMLWCREGNGCIPRTIHVFIFVTYQKLPIDRRTCWSPLPLPLAYWHAHGSYCGCIWPT